MPVAMSVPRVAIRRRYFAVSPAVRAAKTAATSSGPMVAKNVARPTVAVSITKFSILGLSLSRRVVDFVALILVARSLSLRERRLDSSVCMQGCGVVQLRVCVGLLHQQCNLGAAEDHALCTTPSEFRDSL